MSKAKQDAVTVASPHKDTSDPFTADKPGDARSLAVYNGVRIKELTLDTPANLWPTSLDCTEPRQRAAVFAAGNPPDIRCEVGQSVRFTAHHWLIYLDEFLDEESGEVKPGPVLVLYDKDGKMFKTTSQFAPRRLKAALELYGPEDWQGGITFLVVDRPSRRPGRHYHDIRIVLDDGTTTRS